MPSTSYFGFTFFLIVTFCVGNGTMRTELHVCANKRNNQIATKALHI